jgi:hypothetical protein
MAMPMPPVAVMMMVVDDDVSRLDEILPRRNGERAHWKGAGDGEARREGCADHNGGGSAAKQGSQH